LHGAFICSISRLLAPDVAAQHLDFGVPILAPVRTCPAGMSQIAVLFRLFYDDAQRFV
jgi:hypothetical protein